MIEMAKGTRIFLPKEKLVRNFIVDTIKSVFELYGFLPIETPVLQRFETLAAKYAGGAEILKETFRLKDQGGRELGLRYDLTVPLALLVSQNPQLKMPFKCYQIGAVFRDGPVEKGRVRELWQCDADIVGSKTVSGEAQLLNLALTVFEKLGLSVTIKLNSVKILNSILDMVGITKDRESVLLTLDKFYKIGAEGVRKELKEKGLSENQIKKIMDVLQTKGNNKEKIKKLRKVLGSQEGLDDMEALISSVYKNIEFSLPLARGLSYYTGMIFEITLKGSDIAIAAGGRYDKMISQFLSSEREYPAVGISFGLERIFEILKDTKMESLTKVYIIPINTQQDSLKIAKELRKAGISADTDLSNRGISKNLEYASSLGVPFVLIVGPKELKKKSVKLRNMKTGKEKFMKIKDLADVLKNILAKRKA